jgi:hypothetical protein
MKKSLNYKKKGIFKKIFIKICRFFDYEIIDQGSLYLPNSELMAENNLSKLGKNSIVIPMGKIEIKRKIKSLDIILRTCASVNMLSQSKKRVFDNPKSSYTLKTLNSIINSINYNKKIFDNIKLKLTIIDHNSEQIIKIKIKDILSKQTFNTSFLDLDISKYEKLISKTNQQGKTVTANQISNMSNIHQSLDIAKNCEDLIYFVEDDYIHKPETFEEMIFAYERISNQIDRELILCPSDYPYLYNNINNTKILLGNKYHWRSVGETLCTFLTSKKIINKYWEKFTSTCKTEHYPFEKPFHDIYEKEMCLSPIPSLAVHLTNINSVYGLSPFINYKNLWEKNEIKD